MVCEVGIRLRRADTIFIRNLVAIKVFTKTTIFPKATKITHTKGGTVSATITPRSASQVEPKITLLTITTNH